VAESVDAVEEVLTGGSVSEEDVVVVGSIGIGGCIVCDGVNKDVAKPDVKDKVGRAKLGVTLLVVWVSVSDDPPLLVVSELTELELSVVGGVSEDAVSLEDSRVLVLDSTGVVVVTDGSEVGTMMVGRREDRIGI